jgi:hypothetical protein
MDAFPQNATLSHARLVIVWSLYICEGIGVCAGV